MTKSIAPSNEIKFCPVLLAQDDGKGQLKVWCPYCVQFHFHGAGGGEGHRVAHCEPWSRSPFLDTGYVIRKAVPRSEADALSMRRMTTFYGK